MKALLVVLALLIANSAHAGMYDELSKQEDAQMEANMRAGEQRDLENRINQVRNAVAQAMGVDPSSVVYDGISDRWLESGFTYRVGQWACLGSLQGASCIDSYTHQRQVFSLKKAAAKRRSLHLQPSSVK